MIRALLLEGDAGTARGLAVLERLDLLRLNDRVLGDAGTLLPKELRSLDAIHLASAHQLGSDLGQLITYDEGMVEAVRLLGITAASP